MSKNPRITTIDRNAADDKFRSRYIQRLIQEMDRDAISRPGQFIPRTIVQYWDDRDIPSDVQECLDKWRVMDNFGFKRLIFDMEQAQTFIKHHFSNTHLRAFNSCLHPAMRSDYFRLCFLTQNGGLYVDADDTLKKPEAIMSLMNTGGLWLQPLCYRLSTDSMVIPTDFVNEAGNDLVFYVNNDPIIAPARHPVMQAALIQATDRLIIANGTSKDIQWLTGPGNLSEILVRYSLHRMATGAEPDFRFIFTWVQIAPCDWTLSYRNDNRNWRLWAKGDTPK